MSDLGQSRISKFRLVQSRIQHWTGINLGHSRINQLQLVQSEIGLAQCHIEKLVRPISDSPSPISDSPSPISDSPSPISDLPRPMLVWWKLFMKKDFSTYKLISSIFWTTKRLEWHIKNLRRTHSDNISLFKLWSFVKLRTFTKVSKKQWTIYGIMFFYFLEY